MQTSSLKVGNTFSHHSIDLPLLEKITLGQESFCYAATITINSSYVFIRSFLDLECLTSLVLGEYALKGAKGSSLLLSSLI